jgi:hypothetical protein
MERGKEGERERERERGKEREKECACAHVLDEACFKLCIFFTHTCFLCLESVCMHVLEQA